VPLSNFVRRGFGFVHHSLAIPYHEVPNPNITIRNFFIALRRAGLKHTLLASRPGEGRRTAMRKLRIVTLGFGTARQRMALERWTSPKPPRRTRSPRHGVPSCGGKSAGVAKRPRARSPTETPEVTIRRPFCSPPQGHARTPSWFCSHSASSLVLEQWRSNPNPNPNPNPRTPSWFCSHSASSLVLEQWRSMRSASVSTPCSSNVRFCRFRFLATDLNSKATCWDLIKPISNFAFNFSEKKLEINNKGPLIHWTSILTRAPVSLLAGRGKPGSGKTSPAAAGTSRRGSRTCPGRAGPPHAP
jgi:hypothetical protein